MSFSGTYPDSWDVLDDPPGLDEPSDDDSDIESNHPLDRHPSLSAAERNPSLLRR